MRPNWSNNRRTYPALACLAVVSTLVFFFYPATTTLKLQEATPYDDIAEHAYDQADEHMSTHAAWQEPYSSTDEPATFVKKPSRSECSLTKVSMLYGAHRFAQLELALETHRQHSERWGCGLEVLNEDISSRKLYSKHYFLLSTMLHELAQPADARRKWLMWVDADSILLNPALSPEVFLPPAHMDDVYALVTADHNGLNDGIFYLRVHPSSVDLLTQIAAYPLAHPDEDFGWFGEQAAMSHTIAAIEARPGYDATRHPGIVWAPRDWFNTYEFEHGFEGAPGHFLVHFAGLAETRLQHMADWLDELAAGQEKWEVPLERSVYKDSIAEFWREVEANSTARHTTNKSLQR